MNDKELLKRAANAAIVAGRHEIEFHGGSNSPMVYKDDGLTLRGWNPLISLSDATELALLLNIDIQDRYGSEIWAGGAKMAWCCEFYTDPGSKRLAYCRAATRAAASAGMYEGK